MSPRVLQSGDAFLLPEFSHTSYHHAVSLPHLHWAITASEKPLLATQPKAFFFPTFSPLIYFIFLRVSYLIHHVHIFFRFLFLTETKVLRVRDIGSYHPISSSLNRANIIGLCILGCASSDSAKLRSKVFWVNISGHFACDCSLWNTV